MEKPLNNNKDFFPIVLIPQIIEEAKKSTPEIPEPTKPTLPDDELGGCLLWVFTGLLAFFAYKIEASRWGKDATWYWLGIVGLVLWFVKTRITMYQKNGEYKADMAKYEKDLLEYGKQVEEANKPEKLEEYRHKQVLSVLSRTVRPIIEPEKIKWGEQEIDRDLFKKRGATEHIFKQYLIEVFGNKIFTVVQMGYFVGGRSYEPDFLYLDEETNLHIDIEIDEEYTAFDPKPIHYIGADDRRNNYFLEQGWVVVRFSEQQVVKQPLSCCKVIAEVIHYITKENTYIDKLKNQPDLRPVKRWTYEDAMKFIKLQIREKRNI